MSELSPLLARVHGSADLSRAQMRSAMRHIMSGEGDPEEVGAFLKALAEKGECLDELAGGVEVLRELLLPVRTDTAGLLDTCGTGGDGKGLFNISTAAALVAASGGARVAKHGNRSASSKSGSADVLEALGVRLDLSPEQLGRCLDECGIAFMFAPAHHAAMKHVAPVRRALGIRTIFNLLGPLSNPAGAKRQLLGVFSADWLEPMARACAELGAEHVMAVHSGDGLDEISTAAPTEVAEHKNGELARYRISPADYGIAPCSLEALKVEGPEQSAALVRGALEGTNPAARDIVVLNAGAALAVAGVAKDLKAGVKRAGELVAQGRALEKLEQLKEFTRKT